MTLHDLITLMILSIGTSGTNEIQYIEYTSEYISKLQIHQQGEKTNVKGKTHQDVNYPFCLLVPIIYFFQKWLS